MTNKKIGLVIVLLITMAIAWRVVSLGLADHFAIKQPERALFWRSNHPEALFRMAEKSVNNKDWNKAQFYAEQAISNNALDGRPLRVLGQVAFQNKNEKLAYALFLKSVALAPRDAISQVWLLEYALRHQQAKAVVKHLDALFSVTPESISSLMPQAMVLALNPKVQDHLIEKLASNPTWRRHLLTSLASSELELDQVVAFFIKLNSQSKLDSGEYVLLINRLNKENRYMQSYVTWANLIPKNQQKFLGNIFDGEFELPFEDQVGAFAWAVREVDGAQTVQMSTRGTFGENSLLVDFDGRRVPYANLSQLLVLPAGQWQMSFRAKAENLDTNRGLIWRVVCQGGGTLAESAAMRGQFNWKEMSFQFNVPENCQGQQLILMIPARIPAETLINGSLWLDSVKIQQVDPTL